MQSNPTVQLQFEKTVGAQFVVSPPQIGVQFVDGQQSEQYVCVQSL